MLNQYEEELKFTKIDGPIPNRGIPQDQFLGSLDYEQTITQIAAADHPESGLAGNPGLPIHHEPGLWLHIVDQRTDGLDIARLATIPHGNSVLALGKSEQIAGDKLKSGRNSLIPEVNGLPVGVKQSLTNPYLEPYAHFNSNPFKGVVTDDNFPGFNPVQPHLLLELANQGAGIK